MAKKNGGRESSSEARTQQHRADRHPGVLHPGDHRPGRHHLHGLRRQGRRRQGRPRRPSDKATAADKKTDEAEARRIGLKIAAGVADPAEQAQVRRRSRAPTARHRGRRRPACTRPLQTQLNLPTRPCRHGTRPPPTSRPRRSNDVASDLQKQAANAADAKDKAATGSNSPRNAIVRAAYEELQAKFKTAQDNLAKAKQGRRVRAARSGRVRPEGRQDQEAQRGIGRRLKLEIQELRGPTSDRQDHELKSEVDTSQGRPQAVRREVWSAAGEARPGAAVPAGTPRRSPSCRPAAQRSEGQQSIVNDPPKGRSSRAGRARSTSTSARRTMFSPADVQRAAGRFDRQGRAATPRKGAVEVDGRAGAAHVGGEGRRGRQPGPRSAAHAATCSSIRRGTRRRKRTSPWPASST